MSQSQPRDKSDYIFKIVIIGNANCGKSTLLNYFVSGKVKKTIQQTVGVEFASKSIQVNSKSVKLQLWDTAGQERYRSVARTYYRGTVAAIVVCDVTNSQSFDSLPQWISDAREFGKSDLNIMICANKIDLIEERVVSNSSLQQLAKSENVSFQETSAYSGQNIDQAFLQLAEQILEKIEKGDIDENEQKMRQLHPMNQTRKITTGPNEKNKEYEQSGQCYYC